MINGIKDGYNLLFWIFVIICLYGGTNSKELESNYTPVSNNNIEVIRPEGISASATESNNEWGSISDPSY